MSRVLILGGYGMLGHQLATRLQEHHEVAVSVRGSADEVPAGYPDVEIFGNLDLRNLDQVGALLTRRHFDVVINAAGVIKHRLTPEHIGNAIAINALLPQELAATCAAVDSRSIHFSTDCVFSGEAASQRGEQGYRVEDPPDARDLYGRSKLLGEPSTPGSLCLRTSLVGPELRGHHALIEWYLDEQRARIEGYTHALFNGLTTPVAARLVDFLIREQPELNGLWHVGSEPISKYALLQLIREHFKRGPEIAPDEQVYCDRRLDSTPFRERTGWSPPGWPDMIAELAAMEQP